MMGDVDQVEVVTAHHERATLRVGDVFLKVDADQTRTDIEVHAMVTAPVPTPEVLWREPPVLALAALPGTALGRLGEPSTASPAAWAAAGVAVRTLHDARCRHGPAGAPRSSQLASMTSVRGSSTRRSFLPTWSNATAGHEEHLGDVVAGYGTDVDLDVIRAWWSLRSLLAIRWLAEHGFGPPDKMPEVALLRSQT
jgi:hypothetical protein